MLHVVSLRYKKQEIHYIKKEKMFKYYFNTIFFIYSPEIYRYRASSKYLIPKFLTISHKKVLNIKDTTCELAENILYENCISEFRHTGASCSI